MIEEVIVMRLPRRTYEGAFHYGMNRRYERGLGTPSDYFPGKMFFEKPIDEHMFVCYNAY